ncbi:MAG: hypothetical protein AAF289_01930 [Cyanobacteria bacterium P01_A01_bin.135]
MLYLAKVQRNTDEGVPQLLLVAHQGEEQEWLVLPAEPDVVVIPAQEAEAYDDGAAVFVDLDSDAVVTTIRSATEWLLDTVGQYLAAGLTPEDLKQEVDRVEEWRKSLTLKSQDVVRQTLEVETRRDQIQELETKLKQERKQLELMTMQLQNLETRLEDERKQLNILSPMDNADTRLPDPTNTLG